MRKGNSMTDSTIVGASACTGAAVSTAMPVAFTTASLELTLISASIGIVGGMTACLCWFIIDNARNSSTGNASNKRRFNKRNRVSPSLRHRRPIGKPEAPRPFRERIAKFTDQRESDVLLDSVMFDSKMPLWSKRLSLSGNPPKPAMLIRYYLLAIRNLVSKASRRQG